MGPLNPGNKPRYPLDKRLSGRQNRSRRYTKEKYPLSLPGIEHRFLGSLARSLVATPTELIAAPNMKNAFCVHTFTSCWKG
jgi:hypothetical protein